MNKPSCLNSTCGRTSLVSSNLKFLPHSCNSDSSTDKKPHHKFSIFFCLLARVAFNITMLVFCAVLVSISLVFIDTNQLNEFVKINHFFLSFDVQKLVKFLLEIFDVCGSHACEDIEQVFPVNQLLFTIIIFFNSE